MKRKLAVLAVAAAGVATPTLATPAASAGPALVARSCGAGYVHAYLPWGEKCLRAGEFCKIGNKAYARYGFYCPPNGHLRRR